MNLVLSRHGIWYSRFTYSLPSGKRKEIRRSLRTRCKLTARRKLQLIIQRCDDVRETVEAPYKPEKPLSGDSNMLLSEAIEKWMQERIAEGVSLNERKRIQTYLNKLLAVTGDYRASEFKRQQANQFKDALLASDRSPTTINNYLKRARMLFNWLKTRVDGLDNPFDGLAIRVTKPPSEQRKAYTSDDLGKLDKAITGLPDHKRWIIQIARYSGMRQGEVCQLYAENIAQLECGTWVFDVSDRLPNQKLKNTNSIRLVPVHSKLLKLGLIDLVERRKRGRLFPELSYSEGRGYGRYFQKWFGEWRIRKGLPEYHSLRHMVATVFKNEGVPEQFAASILGHGSGAISYNRYGKRVDVKKLRSVVELIH